MAAAVQRLRLLHLRRAPISLLGSSASAFVNSSCFSSKTRSGWFGGLEGNKKSKLPPIVSAGERVLHERAAEVNPKEIKSERVQSMIDDMIRVMRKAPGVGLAAPQIGIPLRIIVLEDKQEYISLDTQEDVQAQDRRPFDLLVILNPKLKNITNMTSLFFEGCLSVNGFLGVVERYLDIEVSGYDRHGDPIKINATGWQARILQHECDHLDGTLYVDKMLPRTFRTMQNIDMPLPSACPKLGPR
ncbi:Peptide deformylase 1A, chloroplastic/mitochondrial [Stylosanthes scabra]|uniref:Peptide deformylase n=1 Tax=Stylosanthes scabra TaxID=79078 RepID=A0ABU6R9F5_9FABA|nr:Peptide deformylase 1A, chloroplastic/mitochondrial [Stylosanthes scabra]